MELKFRPLKADEIECRVQQMTPKGAIVLLYKDARCDMRLLDETVGPMNWQRSHELINGNLFCTVGIRNTDSEFEQWVWKQDVGTESNTEKEKGQTSDSFKRACTNWGIGRELYTSPFIFIPADKYKSYEKNGKPATNDKFKVSLINTEDGVIKLLEIVNTGQYGDGNEVVFRYPKFSAASKPKAEPKSSPKPSKATKSDESATDEEKQLLWDTAGLAGFDENAVGMVVRAMFKKNSVDELTSVEVKSVLERLEKKLNG